MARKTGGRSELDAMWQLLASLNLRLLFSHAGSPAIGNGTTAGRLRTNASVTGNIAGVAVTKASTDDLWDLHSETATPAATFRAYWLYVNSAGTASFVAGTNQSSAALAVKALPAPDPTKCIFGVYTAGAATNFANALAAQGTITNGIPAGAPIGVKGQTYVAPAIANVVSE